MSTRWKKVVSIIGISTMLAANSIGAMAEEVADGNEITAVKENDEQPDDTADNQQADDSSPDATATDKQEDATDGATDSKSENSTADEQPEDDAADDSSEDDVTDGEPEDKSEDTMTDEDQSEDTVADENQSEEAVTDEDQSEDDVTDENQSEDTVTDGELENVVTEDPSEDVTTTDEQPEDVVTVEQPETIVEDENAEEVTEADIPTDLGWSDTEVGCMRFKHNESFDELGRYVVDCYVELYKDGELKGYCWRFVIAGGGSDEYVDSSLIGVPKYDFKEHETRADSIGLTETGTYKYRLKVRESDETSKDFSEGKVSEFSEEYQYTQLDNALPVPQNVRWSSAGVLEWDAVEGADCYRVWLLMSEDGSAKGLSIRDTKCDLNSLTTDENFTYVAVVCAQAEKDGNTMLYSDFSEEVFYKASDTNDGIAGIVDKVNADSSVEEVTSAVTELASQYQGEDKNKLQIAMQTSDETQAQVKKLDDLYAQKANIETKTASIGEGVALDASKISMVGAALNADEGASIQMNIRKPEPANDVISNNKDYWENEYGNAVQFSMDVTGINTPEDLAIPITITMPIPNGLNPDRLVVLHQQADGQLVQIENKVDREAGTVQFTITHFSEFIFAETASEGGEDNEPGTGDDSNEPGTDSPDQPSEGDSNEPGTDTPDQPSEDDSNNASESTGNNTNTSSSHSSSSSSSSTPTVTVLKAKAPVIGESEGWSSLEKEVNEAIAKKAADLDAVVWVKLNDAEIIPASALRTIAGKDVTVCFVTKTGVIVNVNGSLVAPNAVGEVKIISAKGIDGRVSVKIRNTVPDLDKSITIFVKTETNAADKTLYFIDAAKNQLPFRTSGIAANGYAAFEVPFVNADYTVK